MLLSNARKYFLLAAFCTVVSQGCGEQPTNGVAPQSRVPEPTSEFPFSTSEPEVYQGEVVAAGGAIPKKWFIARKKDRWRIDFFDTDTPSRTRLRTDVVYSIDHKRKVFTIAEEPGETVTGITSRFFRGKEYRKFEKVELVNGVTRYRSERAEDTGVVIVSVDDTTGMMLRLELLPNAGSGTAAFGYEMRELRYEVNDATFEIPSGYRKVSSEEYRRTEKPR